MIIRFFGILFLKFCILLPIAALLSCGGEEVFVAQNKPTVKIISQPSAAEGAPNINYIFSAKVENAPIKTRFEWLVGDSAIALAEGKQTIEFKFPRDGWYYITLKVYDAADGRLVASDIYQANIRSGFPIIAMISVPAGSFNMGSDKNFYEQPVHSVVIARSMAVGKYEIMQSEWKMLMGYSPAWFSGDSLPVENITWLDAIDFCNRLSTRAGYTPCYTILGDSVSCNFALNGYRLPTEAEWEYLARAGTNGDSYNGNYQPATEGCYPLDPALNEIGWYCGNASDSTHKVGLKEPNAYGIYDLLGNVAEYCWDFYKDSYYQSSPSVSPTGPISGDKRIMRGGGFYNEIFTMRVAYRDSQFQEKPSLGVGFRVVRALP